ncbi:hypothetical protein KC362_g4888 [Hortaea werneckii]|nr:hypothetical protein KC362_g4888 [Hortaea werneckii]
MPSPNATAFQTKSTSGPTLAGTALSARDSRIDLLSQQHRDSWKRASNSSGGAPANPLLSGSKSIDDIAAARKSAHRSSMSHQYNTAGKHRSQYHEDQFRYKDSEAGSVREKVQRESPVLAELKTNVIIKDEYTLVTDLSYHLAQRYTRPDSSIMIKVDHSACLALGGTFDPCYILNVTTVPSSMGPSINKRNAALIQSFMADILSVPSDRGIVKFTPIEEVNYAMNGTTMHGEIERLEKHQAENGGVGNAVRRAVTNASRRSLNSSTSNGVPPKLDTDVKTPSSGITPNGVSASDHDDDAKRQKRKSMTTTPPPSSAIPNVFELAATESNDRPSTAHGTPCVFHAGLHQVFHRCSFIIHSQLQLIYIHIQVVTSIPTLPFTSRLFPLTGTMPKLLINLLKTKDRPRQVRQHSSVPANERIQFLPTPQHHIATLPHIRPRQLQSFRSQLKPHLRAHRNTNPHRLRYSLKVFADFSQVTGEREGCSG